MKKTIKYLYICTLFLGFITKVNAAGIGVSTSAYSVTVGGSVNITVSPNDVVGRFSITSSNNNVLSGGTTGVWLEDSSIAYRFTAKNAGTATIRIVPINAATSGGDYHDTKEITITVNPKRVIILSTNNNLSSLGIDGITLSPEFNQDTLEYTTELEPGTEKINVTANAADSTASIAGNGEREVSEGDNNIEVVVTAENGTTKTYLIKATVKEYNPVKVNVNKEEYTVIRNKKNLTPPANYTETSIKIGEEDIPAYSNEVTKYTLIALKDSDGNQNWYVKDNDRYTLYKEYKFGVMTLYPMELKEIPNGYSKTSIKFNDESILAYKFKENSRYALIYAMNVETGKEDIYMYDSVDNSVQVYNDEHVEKLMDENSQYLKLLIGVSSGLLLSIGVLIFILIRNKKK